MHTPMRSYTAEKIIPCPRCKGAKALNGERECGTCDGLGEVTEMTPMDPCEVHRPPFCGCVEGVVIGASFIVRMELAGC